MRIGAHVSISGGLSKSIERAINIGAECIQIFASSPQTWAPSAYTEIEINDFLSKRQQAQIDPVFLHTIYLLNLASNDDSLRRRSVNSLVSYLKWAEKLQAAAVVTHLGSAGQEPMVDAEARVVRSLFEALERSASATVICLETSAGSGATVGSSLMQLGSIMRAVGGGERMRLCVDTAHLFASGYDIANEDGLEATLDELEREIGGESLALIHANDSKAQLGSHVDRHENIGRGYIGEQAFRGLLRHPLLYGTPFIIEVPGFNKAGPDAENIALLRKLARP